MIKGIIFDFGRVISAPKPLSLFRRYEDDLGLKHDMINRIMFDLDIWQEVMLGEKTIDEYWTEIGPLLGLQRPEDIEAFRRRYRDDEAINSGVLDLIQQLHASYKLAVLSNAPAGLTRWLADWGILDLFEVVFCSGDEGVVKPDPASYRQVLERLHIAAREAVFIDDTFSHVTAARAQGLHGIHFKTAKALKIELGKLITI
jgi:putative hydrolase of the HAD superfamily